MVPPYPPAPPPSSKETRKSSSFNRPKCVAAEEESPAFVYHCVQVQLQTQGGNVSASFRTNSSQDPAPPNSTSTRTHKGRVRMSGRPLSGLLKPTSPPSCCFWDTVSLSIPASHLPPV